MDKDSMQFVCRTCMSSQSLHPLFPLASKHHSFERAFFLCTGLQIRMNDGLPQNICKACARFVESAIRFRNKSQTSEEKLRKCFKKFKKKTLRSDANRSSTDCVRNPVELVEVQTQKFEIKSEASLPEDLDSDSEKIDNEINPISPNDHKSSESEQPIEESETKTVKKKKVGRKKPVEDKRYLEMIEGPWDPSEPIQCKICKKIMKTIDGFKQHIKRHTLDYNIICEFCGKPENSWPGLVRHQQAKHGLERDNRFPCTYCDYRALDQEMLETHERRIHTKERPFVCDDCGEAFYSKRVLIQHGIRHRTDKPFQCEQCLLNFKSKSRLTGHIVKVHRKVRKYEYGCPFCPKRYGGPGDVRNHILKMHGIPKEQQGKVIRFNLHQREG